MIPLSRKRYKKQAISCNEVLVMRKKERIFANPNREQGNRLGIKTL